MNIRLETRKKEPLSGTPPIFLMNDQPITCPLCGLRTLVVADFYHTLFKGFFHYCTEDNYLFIEQESDDLS